MESVRTKFIITCTLLILALGGMVIAAHQTVGALQDLKQHESQVSSGDIHLIRPWMTIPYIAHTYHIPEQTLYQALHIKKTAEFHHSTLTTIASQMKHPVNGIIASLQTAITNYRKQHPRHPTRPGPTATPTVQKGIRL